MFILKNSMESGLKILAMLLFSGSLIAQQPIEKGFKLNWKVPVGITTYRTNMIFYKGSIFIGTNGKERNSLTDAQDGVYQLDAKSGKIQHHFQTPFMGDNDVTGIAIADNKLFFGTDNFTFFCYDLTTKKELWKRRTPYDVESAPVTEDFNQDGMKDVFFTVEGNGFYALSGLDGSTLWQKDSVNSNAGNAAPLLVDINNDGVKDIVSSMRGKPSSSEIDGFKMRHYGDYHWALDGKTGETLWLVESGAGIHNSPFSFEVKGEKRIALLDCYGEFKVVDLAGHILSTTNFGYGYFNSPVITQDQHLVIGNYAVEYKDEFISVEEESGIPYLNGNAQSNGVKIDGNVSATTMIADVLGKGSQQAIGVSENGILFITQTDGIELKKYLLHKGAEASVFIQDIDNDGFLELLVAELDGNLYCYKTKSKGKVEHGTFH